MAEPEPHANEALSHVDLIQVACLSLDDHWEAYAVNRKLSKATHPRFHAVLRNYERHLGRTELATVTKEEVESWREALLGSGVSENTVRKVYIAALESFFHWAVEAKKVASNPASEWSSRQDLLHPEQPQSKAR